MKKQISRFLSFLTFILLIILSIAFLSYKTDSKKEKIIKSMNTLKCYPELKKGILEDFSLPPGIYDYIYFTPIFNDYLLSLLSQNDKFDYDAFEKETYKAQKEYEKEHKHKIKLDLKESSSNLEQVKAQFKRLKNIQIKKSHLIIISLVIIINIVIIFILSSSYSGLFNILMIVFSTAIILTTISVILRNLTFTGNILALYLNSYFKVYNKYLVTLIKSLSFVLLGMSLLFLTLYIIKKQQIKKHKITTPDNFLDNY